MTERKRSRAASPEINWPLIFIIAAATAIVPPVALFLIGPFLPGNSLAQNPTLRVAFLTVTPALALGVILISSRLSRAVRATNGVRLGRLLAVIALSLFALYALLVGGRFFL